MNKGSDICECGDYRSQHDLNYCRACGGSKSPYDGCTKFRLAHRANQEELEHWQKYHGLHVVGAAEILKEE